MPKRSYTFLITIGLFGVGLGFIVSSLDPLLYTEKIRGLASASLQNSTLSLITGAALLVALITQPLVGYWSDRSHSRWGNRTPFLVVGVLGLSLALAVVGLASNLWLLLLAAMLVSATANIIQTVWQAFIPEFVAEKQRGQATAIKTVLEVGGVLIGVMVAGFAISQGLLWLPSLVGIALFSAILGLTLYGLRAYLQPPTHSQTDLTPAESTDSGQPLALLWTRLWKQDGTAQGFSVLPLITQNRPFFWWLLNRLLFWSAAIALRTFVFNYIRDGLELSLLTFETLNKGLLISVAAIAIGLILLTGWITDRLGRRPLLIAAGVGGCVGTILLILAEGFTLLAIGGGIVALSGGVYASASWTLATDLAPENKKALYLGLANGATVVGSLSGRLGGPLIDGLNFISQEQQLGYLVVFALAALFFLFSSLVVLKIDRK